MFNEFSSRLTPLPTSDAAQNTSTVVPETPGTGGSTVFADTLSQTSVRPDVPPRSDGTGLPDNGKELPLHDIPVELRQAINADLQGVNPTELQDIFAQLEDLAEISGQSSLALDETIANHERLFSTEVLGLSGKRSFVEMTGPLPGPDQQLRQESASQPLVSLLRDSGLRGVVPTSDGPPASLSALASPTNSDQRSPEIARPIVDGKADPMQTLKYVQTVDETMRQPAPDVSTTNPRPTAAPANTTSDLLSQSIQRAANVDTTGVNEPTRAQPAGAIPVEGLVKATENPRFRAMPMTPISDRSLDLANVSRPEGAAAPARAATVESVARFDAQGGISEGLRADPAQLVKPTSGSFQVHAPSIPMSPATPSTSSAAPLQGMQLADTISTPVQDSAWGERVGEKVALMANHRLQNAEIRLTPTELGPLRVKLTMDDGLANVTFVAQHVATRDAIEQAMPRLREMLEQQGINLGQSSVDDQTAGSAFANGDADDSGNSANATGDMQDGPVSRDEQHASNTVQQRVSTNLLDTFV